MTDVVPESVLSLVRDHVDTIAKVELVIAMARQPFVNWSLEDISSLLHRPRSEVVSAIDQLRASGILRQVPGTLFKLLYAPVTKHLADSCSQLSEAYGRDPSAILRMLRT